ncbi:putative cysteine-rich transmembrane CYSTM domain-containing protein [Helianthus annuus]|uniref:Putative cysteine-rich transmembrane CYSTM domain-containing protein n=1 Tax=Helianthus annuus TaxID=4232 RepID=A0A251VEZ0_HELAN|nr:putative cysteine-rich transmembrane CYSTM domain-containing protein [Helianthus annuus]
MSEAPKTQQMSYNDTHHRIQHRREERGCLYACFFTMFCCCCCPKKCEGCLDGDCCCCN